MFVFTIWLTIGIAALALIRAYRQTGDVFHPLMFVMPMYIFIYGYMPLKQLSTGDLFSYLSEEQFQFFQFVVLGVLVAFIFGCEIGSRATFEAGEPAAVDPSVLKRGALIAGGIGLVAWAYMVRASGGLTAMYSTSYAWVWNDLGYVRDSVYLLLIAIFLLLSRQLYAPRNIYWWLMIGAFGGPWLLQGLLGARRGPTFVLFVSMGVSWYLARNKRPALMTTVAGGLFVGLLMLFLVANRNSIYLGSDEKLSADHLDNVADATTSNEYIFGAGCVTASRMSDQYFWGKRMLAQVVVRPIPRPLMPDKYADFGIPELEQNGGVAGKGLSVLGWKEVPGAAAAMVADLWVELSWGAVPFAAFWGWLYGYCWKRATVCGSAWNTQYVIMLVLSVYLVTQSLEAVTFRLIILSAPTRWIWHLATVKDAPDDAAFPAYVQ